jgi:chorismate synthase
LEAKASGDSVGGVISCRVEGLPAGLGDPMFDGMENRISRTVFGIPAVKGIEFGSGFGGSELLGSENNDGFYLDNAGKVYTKTNNHGGILGGITSGMPLTFRVAMKPTPSIAKEQDSVNIAQNKEVKLKIHGRHDPCIVLRAVPCVEAAAAIAVYDAILESASKGE